MTTETEQTPPADTPRWLLSLSQHRKQLTMAQVIMAIVLILLAIWTGAKFGFELRFIFRIVLLVALALLMFFNRPEMMFLKANLSEVDKTRSSLLILGGVSGLMIAGFGLLFGIEWWDDIYQWLVIARDRKNGLYVLLVPFLVTVGLALMLASLQLCQFDVRTNPYLRRLLYGYNIMLSCLLLLATLVGLNLLIGVRWNPLMDFTASNFYSISPRTQNMLRDLTKPVRVVALLSPSDPYYAQFKTLISNFQQASDMLTLEEVSPTQEQRRAAEVVTKYPGAEPGSVIVVYGNDKEEDYRVVKYEDLFAEPDRADPSGKPTFKFKGEEALMTELSFLAENKKKPMVYFTQGNGELDLNNQDTGRLDTGAGALKRRLEKRNYEVKPLVFSAVDARVPDDATLVVIAGPKTPFAESSVKALRDYMGRSKDSKLVVLLDVVIDTRDKKMRPLGLEGFLNEYGVQVGNERLLSLQFRTERMQFTGDATQILAQVSPDLPQPKLVESFRNELMMFDDVRPVRPAQQQPGMSPFIAQPYVVSFGPVWAEENLAETPAAILANFRRNPQDLKKKIGDGKPIPIAVVVTESGMDPRNPHAMMQQRGNNQQIPRMVVFGDATLASNQVTAERAGRIEYDLLASTFEWLRGKSSAFGVEAKKMDVFTLRANTKADYLRMIFLPPVLILLGIVGLGTGVWVVRRK